MLRFPCDRGARVAARSPLEASPADQCASKAQERLVNARIAFPADAEPAEVVQPGKGPLHHPTNSSESRAVLGSPPCDSWIDSAAPQLAAVPVVVVTAICDDLVGALARPAGLPAMAPIPSRSGSSCVRRFDGRRSAWPATARRDDRRSDDAWNPRGRGRPVMGRSTRRLEACGRGFRRRPQRTRRAGRSRSAAVAVRGAGDPTLRLSASRAAAATP